MSFSNMLLQKINRRIAYLNCVHPFTSGSQYHTDITRELIRLSKLSDYCTKRLNRQIKGPSS